MNIYKLITISAASCAVIIVCMLLIGTILGGNLKENIYKHFLVMLIFNLIGSCCEIFTAFKSGIPGEDIAAMIKFADFVNYSCGNVIYMAFALYLYEYLSMKTSISKVPFTAIVVANGANIVLVALAQLTGIYSQLDYYNHYIQQPTIFISLIVPTITVATFAVMTFKNRKTLRIREWATLIFYLAIPVVFYIIEGIYPDLWISYLGSAIAIFMIYVNIQVELKHQLLEKEAELTESRISIMMSQIQPHFLYNSLLAIQYLCKRDGEQAETAVKEFSKYLRGNLNSLANKASIPFEKELEHVQVYLSLEQKRFEERLQVEFHIQAKGFLIPPLTLQPIVENAIQHGVTQCVEGGKVTISSWDGGENWCVSVEDNGAGFDMNFMDSQGRDGKKHVGIENVRYRLKAMCGGTLEIKSAQGEGTSALIIIPKGASI